MSSLLGMPARQAVLLILCGALVSLLAAKPASGANDAAATATGPERAAEASAVELRSVIATGGVFAAFAATSTLLWWRHRALSGWSWRDAELFGEDTYAGGFDKGVHVFTAYALLRSTTQMYEWLGLSRRSSIIAGTALTSAMATTVEIADAVTAPGFEWSDAVANVVGIAAGLALEQWPAIDRLLGLRFTYVPSAERLDARYPLRLTRDYSGMLVFVDFKPAGLEPLLGVSTGPLRYAIAGLTYGTFGYMPSARPRRREVGLFIGLNLTEILPVVVGTEHAGARAVTTVTKYYAPPLTSMALSRDLNGGEVIVSVGVPQHWRIGVR
jgi:hypothetical protein